jgi:proton glutamate symport protein
MLGIVASHLSPRRVDDFSKGNFCMIESGKQHRSVGFTTTIVISLLLGLIFGLFFGESIQWIKWVGDAFVGLLQMAVLPFVAASLIVNVGRLSAETGWKLLRISAAVLLALWMVSLIALAIAIQAFPMWETGSFYSSSFNEASPSQDWLDLFIPSNPFRSLANNAIPAVVVFSLGLGVAIMALPNKSALLEPLDVAVEALARLNKLVVKLTPVGMFAIVAYTAGTIDFKQLSLIQGYLLTYAGSAIVLCFVVMPILIAAITPYRFGELVSALRDPLIAAFVIGNSFVVLPMIIEAVKKLQIDHEGWTDELSSHQPEYLVPLAYPFPDLGRILGLVFIPFAAWFYGTSIDLDRYPMLAGVGLLGSFGKPLITIPLLLDVAELPSDIFNLFLASGVIAARFGDLMKATHLVAFTVVVSCCVNGTVRWDFRKLMIGAVVSCLLLTLNTALIRSYLDVSFKEQYSRADLVAERQLVFFSDRPKSRISSRVLAVQADFIDADSRGQNRLEAIQERGALRVGFELGKMPFSYSNADGSLVGFDIDMAYYLADDLQVSLEFVPIERSELQLHLDAGKIDIAMSAIEGTVEQAIQMPANMRYMDVTLAIVVPDHEKRNFRSKEDILGIPNLKLAVIKNSFFADRVKRLVPADFEVVELDSASDYFEGRSVEADGLVMSAESGSAWTMLKPQFAVANPLQGKIQVPIYYLTASDFAFEKFLQNWLALKKADGTYERLYDYWILGVDGDLPAPRWCILRNVLGWKG